ncbi:hypothetical protein jhhlp_006858 [Lomentospora prolificans]|uniref:CENP-C homolog n=1 Tax=Lomentospora prolificans TaxID=41688 RepID=A0A2N3N2Z2_9PEZI|nr:hypothetical protein jhhlp_006858 [Lomentospora prolificans]
MAPRGANKTGGRLYELGEQGRKTGVTLPDTGTVDEHGMLPLEGLFSSPQKAPAATPPGADQTGELDMELDTSGPGPSTILAAQKSGRRALPRGRSPAKTNLQSPAVKNPHLGPISSPSRGSIMRSSDRDDSDDHTVTRRLDLKKGQLNGTRTKRTNGTRRMSSRLSQETVPTHDDDDDSIQPVHDSPLGNSIHDQSLEPPAEAEEEVRPKPARRGRPPKAAKPSKPEPVVEEEPPEPPAEPPADESEGDEDPVVSQPARRPGRPAKRVSPNTSKRRTRASPDEDDVDAGEEAPDRSNKRQKTQQVQEPPSKPGPKPAPKAPSKAVTAKPAAFAGGPKRRGRPPKTLKSIEEDQDTSIMEVQRGPPLPKARGLVSIRRDTNAILQTRSGRHSYRPLEFWKGERVEYDQEEIQDVTYRDGRRLVMPSVKEVVRVEEQEEEKRRRGPRPRGRKPGSRRRGASVAEEDDEQEEPEEWEREPGVISGDVVLWEPQHELYPPGNDAHVEVVEDQLAVSSNAILTRDIHDATFRFAKTLNLSFMGSGIVDLPAGAEKKPKNSRKMQMVFFVFYGKVLVTVNETEFRISAGGQWFVPRGNYYSIKNDYDRPARIFFAQACEVFAPPPEEGEEAEEEEETSG